MTHVSELVAANNQFAFALLRESLAAASSGNVLAAPVGLFGDFVLLLNGANASAQDEIRAALSLPDIPLLKLNYASAELKYQLGSTVPIAGAEQLVLARALWIASPNQFSPEFIETAQHYHGVAAQQLPTDEAAVHKVNQWVSQQTEGVIDHLVSSMADADFVLTDATLLKACWFYEFNEAMTREGAFHPLSGPDRNVPFMRRQAKFAHLDAGDFEAVLLPFSGGAVYIFLPSRDIGIRQFQESLTASNWEKWTADFSARPGIVELPRFRVDYHAELSHSLSRLGLASLFADYRSLQPAVTHPAGAKLDRVEQAIRLDIDEKGIKVASAAVHYGFFGSSQPKPETPFHLIVDRPFFIAVQHSRTDAILYLGIIHDPA